MKKTIINGIMLLMCIGLIVSTDPQLGDAITLDVPPEVDDYIGDAVESAQWIKIETFHNGKTAIAEFCITGIDGTVDCQKRTLYNNYDADSRYCNRWDISDEGKNCLEWLNYDVDIFTQMKIQEHTEQVFQAMYDNTLATPTLSFDDRVDVDIPDADTPGATGDLG